MSAQKLAGSPRAFASYAIVVVTLWPSPIGSIPVNAANSPIL